jgi:hypothetical protein
MNYDNIDALCRDYYAECRLTLPEIVPETGNDGTTKLDPAAIERIMALWNEGPKGSPLRIRTTLSTDRRKMRRLARRTGLHFEIARASKPRVYRFPAVGSDNPLLKMPWE